MGATATQMRVLGCPGVASLCTLSTGPRAGDYTHREGLEHKCRRDVLLGRLRSSEDQIWKRIRPRPTKTSFVGSYYLCKGEWTIAGLVPARSSSSQAYIAEWPQEKMMELRLNPGPT